MMSLVLALLVNIAYVGSFDCFNNFVCDPSVGTDIAIKHSHFENEGQCEQACQVGHPNNPCKFFTWVPKTEAHVPNCFQMSECVEMTNPIHGEKSGAWSCEDESIFCPPIGNLPPTSNKDSHWNCDHDIHPYGDVAVFQDVVCRAS